VFANRQNSQKSRFALGNQLCQSDDPDISFMKQKHVSLTPATAALKAANIEFGEHPYDYVDKGGTAVSSAALGVPEHAVIKTLVMQDDKAQPLIVLMHGDCTVSTKNLARQMGVKSISPCTPEAAQKHSGYQVGGTSPFGTRKTMRVCMERSILSLEKIFINGGQRGYLVSIAPQVCIDVLGAQLVDCALKDAS
jgi:Cys-tRNA(Pro) deacylase